MRRIKQVLLGPTSRFPAAVRRQALPAMGKTPVPPGLAVAELTGIMKGTGAKVKADVAERGVTFRGALKASVPFAELDAEARGTLLILRYREHTIEVSAGAKAAALAARINRG